MGPVSNLLMRDNIYHRIQIFDNCLGRKESDLLEVYAEARAIEDILKQNDDGVLLHMYRYV